MPREAFVRATGGGPHLVPSELTAQMDQVVVLVEDDPSPGEPGPLGLYEGIPLTERDRVRRAVGILSC